MTRKEDLVRRLCRYLGARIDVRSPSSAVWELTILIGFKYVGYRDTWKTDAEPEPVWMWNSYLSWSDILDVRDRWRRGFMDYVRWLNTGGRVITDNPAFEYSSLDELEIKLAASGF